MKPTEILNISGYSALFKVIAQGRNNVIVESLADGKRMPTFSSQKIISIADISIYTTDKNMTLNEVFNKMYEAFEKKEIELNFKDKQNEMFLLFEKAIPNYDKNRVRISHLRKIMNWYNMLVKNNLLPFEEEKKEVNEEKSAKETISEVKETINTNDK